MQIPPKGVTLVVHPLVQVKLTHMRDAQTGSDDFRARVGELAVLMLFESLMLVVVVPSSLQQTLLTPLKSRTRIQALQTAPSCRLSVPPATLPEMVALSVLPLAHPEPVPPEPVVP